MNLQTAPSFIKRGAAALTLAGVCAASFSVPAAAQRNFDDVVITAQEVAPGIAVLFGAGGNIGVLHGEDGTVIIDDQFAPLTAKIEAVVADLGAPPVKYVINTHWHFDHTGGNENFGKKGALIFAHHNVRTRLASGGSAAGNSTPPAPKEALPVVTYDQGVTMHFNGQRTDLMFTGGGHTDGDSVIIWPEANVIHTGDLYFNIPGFPFVDVNSGGSVVNLMNTLDAVIRRIDDETVVIPGHGAISNKAELVAYRQMIGDAVEAVKAQMGEGVTREAVIAAAPLKDFNRGSGFIGPDAFAGAIFDSLN